jgi:NADH dehydrogenase/NADH:ubiquinone oxidoreductase subunit G
VAELTVDGRTAIVRQGRTILEAAREVGIEIPTLCCQDGLPHRASCMVCLVENEETGGLLPACSIPAEDGQRILVSSRRAQAARRTSVELLLAEHEGDCEAPCARICPSAIDIPSVLRRISRGQYAEALRLVHRARGAADGSACTGCAAPCERACRLARQGKPIGIRALVSGAQLRAAAGALEAARCLQCDCLRKSSCVLRRLERELGADRRRFAVRTPFPADSPGAAGGLSWQPSKCVKCGICVRVSDAARTRPGVAFSGRGASVGVRGALGADLATALGDAGVECATRCPTGALARRP